MELRVLISLINENSHPAFVFMVLQECYQRVRLDTHWRELGTSELDLLVTLNVCQHREVVREARTILAKNQISPLNREDAQRLSALYGELAKYPPGYRGLEIAMETLDYIIYFATYGYKKGLELAS